MRLVDRATIEKFSGDGVWGDATLQALFRSAAARGRDRLAVCDPPNKPDICGGAPRQLTYGEVEVAASRLADLFRTLGLGRDDVVAMQLPNTVEQIVVFLGALEAGLIVSPLPLLWREHELRSALPWIKPRALITSGTITGRKYAEMMCAATPDLLSVRAILAFGADTPDGVIPLDGVFENSDDVPQPEPAPLETPVNANDVATICWSGGDGILPGAVPRSHNQWIAAGMMQLLEAGIERDSTILCPYPLSGLVPIGAFMVPWLLSGGTLCLHHPIDTDVLAVQLRDHSVSYTGLPPAVIDVLKRQGVFDPGSAGSKLSALACLWPAAILPKNAEEYASDLMMPVIDLRSVGEYAYHARRRVAGEAPGLLGQGDVTYPTNKSGGAALLSTRVKGGITSNAAKASLLTGDLMIKSPMMFDEFYPTTVEDADEPVLAKDSRGYVNTGLRCLLIGNVVPKIDIIRHDGNVICHGGLNVSANELDQLYSEHEMVTEAAAFSFEDPVMGERIMAAIVPLDGADISLSDFADYLRARQVASFKVPDQLVTVKMIPRDDNGAILRDRMLDYV